MIQLILITLTIIVLGIIAIPDKTIQAQQIISSTVASSQERPKYHVDDDALNFLTTSDGPYKIISVIGQARKGKSTTLNALISTLINQGVTPFKTSNNIDPCTHGIWMYIIPKCVYKECTEDGEKCVAIDDQKDTRISKYNEEMQCMNSDYSFIFLDIEGSDTATNDVALRYASIVTLLSSKIFLFIHQTLYAHDIDYVNVIELFRKTMSRQNIDVPFEDLDLGIIIREPLGNLVGGKLEEKINKLFQEFSGINLNNDSALLTQNLPVFAVDSLENSKNFKKSIHDLVEFIFDETNYLKSAKGVKLCGLSGKKITEFFHIMIEAMNENEDLNAICIGCLFTKIIEWDDFGEWSECSEECGGGIQERRRTCNSGRDNDCSKYRHGSAIHQQGCNEIRCPIRWGEWHPWSACTKECGSGEQERFRKCTTGDPSTYSDSKYCEKKFGDQATEKINCNEFPCPIEWSEWSSWSECDEKCGGGTQKRIRNCGTGDSQHCEKKYGTKNTEEINCNVHSCFNILCRLGIYC